MIDVNDHQHLPLTTKVGLNPPQYLNNMQGHYCVNLQPIKGILVKDVNATCFVHENFCNPHILHHCADHHGKSAGFYDAIRVVTSIEGDRSFRPTQVERSSWSNGIDILMHQLRVPSIPVGLGAAKDEHCVLDVWEFVSIIVAFTTRNIHFYDKQLSSLKGPNSS